MKKSASLTLAALMLLLTLLISMVACTQESEQGNNTQSPSVSETEEELLPPPIDPAGFGDADITYECQDDSVLSTYKNKTAEDFVGVRSHYLQKGCSVYAESEKAGNLFCTLVNGNFMAHIYWIKSSGELNLVLSDTAGDTLPPAKTPEIMQGSYTPSITQMKDNSNVNGMCYIIQLPDGSFIVYDGSFENCANNILAQIKELHGAEGTPLVRAWVLTHSHNDHWPAFAYICNNKASAVKVEYVIFAPIEAELGVKLGGDYYFTLFANNDIAKLGAKIVYAHTGMEFSFGDFKMEVLLAADDLFKVGNHNNNFNSSSLVTRIYGQDYSALFLADITKEGTGVMTEMYGDYLKSDFCQVAHHGVEDVPLEFYELVEASILAYPCNKYLYSQPERHYNVRKALENRSYTKEVLVAGADQFTREWGTTFAADAPLSKPGYKNN